MDGTFQILTLCSGVLSLSLSHSPLPVGCAFVTYINRHSAIEAQKALHEKKTLPGVRKIE